MSEHRLPILTRYVHNEGGVTTSHHVMCPRRAHAATADECWVCPHVNGVSHDIGQNEPILVCWPEGDAAPRPDRSGDRATSTPVAELMTRDVHCATSSLALEVVAELMTNLGIGSAPVVDDDGHPLGIVTKTDLLRAAREPLRHGDQRRTVGEVMTPIAFSISDRASVAQAAALMAFEHVHHVPVLSAEGRVVGIVSSLDVARFVGQVSGYLR